MFVGLPRIDVTGKFRIEIHGILAIGVGHGIAAAQVDNYFLPLIMLKDSNWYPLTIGLNQWKDQASTDVGISKQGVLRYVGNKDNMLAMVFNEYYGETGTPEDFFASGMPGSDTPKRLL